MDAELHRHCANTIKGLAMDAVQAANSGHPGMPMGMADAAIVLWTRFLRFDPTTPEWPDRDRFVLSAGHGSMLQYALLHLSGYDLPMEELRAFRQWGSRTPGHPEVGETPGVETTTGPLGQGFANAIGMAIAERTLRETFGPELCDHRVFGICSDGDLMEGISSEAASVAGHLGLGRLVMLYDDNQITIDGSTELSFSEDVLARFEAFGWHTLRVDGHDPEAVAQAIEAGLANADRPSLIACRTVIGQGSPSFEGTARTHGAALGAGEVRLTKERLGMNPDEHFAVPEAVATAFRSSACPELREAWEARVSEHPEGARYRSWLSPDWRQLAQSVEWPSISADKPLATRKASAACLKAIQDAAPFFVGGSSDLSGSNGVPTRTSFSRASFAGASSLHFGVREHAAGAICNGMSLHGGLRPFTATFLVFHDYQRPSVRMSALMRQPVTYLYSHDSIFLGEDGPTHQPIATLLALRALPGLEVWRPADAVETVACWKESLLRTRGPTAMVLSRQSLPVLEGLVKPSGVARGGYILSDPEGEAPADVVLIGTGSEVALCLEAQRVLASREIRARVVSMPCRERFADESEVYREGVLPPGIPRVSVEAAATLGWERWIGERGVAIGIDRYGASAPASVLAEQLGFTPERVADVATSLVRTPVD